MLGSNGSAVVVVFDIHIDRVDNFISTEIAWKQNAGIGNATVGK